MSYTEERAQKYRQRNHQHRHNGLMGSNRMMLQHLRNIQHSSSCTPEAKELAAQMEPLAIQLADDIYTYRMDPDGKKTMEHKDPMTDMDSAYVR